MGWGGIYPTSCWNCPCLIKPFNKWLCGWFGEGGLNHPRNCRCQDLWLGPRDAIIQPQNDVSKRGGGEDVSPNCPPSSAATAPQPCVLLLGPRTVVWPVLPSLSLLLFLPAEIQHLVHKPVGWVGGREPCPKEGCGEKLGWARWHQARRCLGLGTADPLQDRHPACTPQGTGPHLGVLCRHEGTPGSPAPCKSDCLGSLILRHNPNQLKIHQISGKPLHP